MKIDEQGIAAFVVPIMISYGARLRDDCVNVIFELLMILGLFNPSLDLSKSEIPLIIVVFQRFSRNGSLTNDSDNDEDTISFNEMAS